MWEVLQVVQILTTHVPESYKIQFLNEDLSW